MTESAKPSATIEAKTSTIEPIYMRISTGMDYAELEKSNSLIEQIIGKEHSFGTFKQTGINDILDSKYCVWRLIEFTPKRNLDDLNPAWDYLKKVGYNSVRLISLKTLISQA